MPDGNEIPAPNKPKRPTYLPIQAKRSLIRAFESSTQTMTGYCKEHNLSLSTFSSWVKKYGAKKQAAFVPVQVQKEAPRSSTPKKQKESPLQHIEIHRGDLKVVLPVMTDVSMTVEIIKGVLVCN